MHIGNFLAHYPEPGGTTKAVHGLSRALVRLGHIVTIYSYRRTDEFRWDEASAQGLRVRSFECDRKNPFPASSHLQEVLQRNEDQLDLLVIHGMFNPFNVAVSRAVKRSEIPYVVCPHAPYHPAVLSRNRFRKAIYGLIWERAQLNSAMAVQVLADHHLRYLKDYGVQVPGICVPNGFDPGEVPDPAPNGKNNGSGPEFLYLGRIDMYTKGLDLLLEAFSAALIAGGLPRNARLSFAGRDWGDQKTLVRLAARLGLSGNVTSLGHLDNPWPTIASSDVCVFPSRYEGFGLSALEALLSAKPVIISRIAGMSPWIERADCGFIVEPTVESIRDGLVQAFQCRAGWHERGECGRDFAYRHLTWDKAGQRAGEAYEQLLAHA